MRAATGLARQSLGGTGGFPAQITPRRRTVGRAGDQRTDSRRFGRSADRARLNISDSRGMPMWQAPGCDLSMLINLLRDARPVAHPASPSKARNWYALRCALSP